MSVAEAAKRMQAANSDAALVCERVGSEWKVQGILTDTDVMRKVKPRLQLRATNAAPCSLLTRCTHYSLHQLRERHR